MGAVLHCQEQPYPVVQLLQDMAESFQAFLEGRVAAAPGEGLGGVRQLCEFVGVFVAEVDEIVEGLPGEGLQRLATQPLGRDAGVFEHAQGARVDASGRTPALNAAKCSPSVCRRMASAIRSGRHWRYRRRVRAVGPSSFRLRSGKPVAILVRSSRTGRAVRKISPGGHSPTRAYLFLYTIIPLQNPAKPSPLASQGLQ